MSPPHPDVSAGRAPFARDVSVSFAKRSASGVAAHGPETRACYLRRVRPATDPLPSRGDVLEVQVQTPRGSFWKRDDEGRRTLCSPFPVPFNYGFVPGWLAEDGDQLDALLLGTRVARGGRCRGHVVAVVAFRDQGVADPKVILAAEPRDELRPWERRTFELFFHLYGGIKRVLRPGSPSGFEGWIR